MSTEHDPDARTPIVVPDMGCVLGCQLGGAWAEVVGRWPGGAVRQLAEGRRSYSLTQDVGLCRAPVEVSYHFVDERLTAVQIKRPVGAEDGLGRHLHRQVAAELVTLLDVAPTLQDEGYSAYDIGQMRISVDALDAIIRFEESL